MDIVIVAVIAAVVLYILYTHGKLSGVVAKLKAYEDHIVPGLKDQVAAAGNPVIKVVGVPVAPKPPVAVQPEGFVLSESVKTPANPTVKPEGFVLSEDVKAPAGRDINVEEPLIAEWDSKFNAGQGAHMLTQMANFYCAHPELGPLDYAQVYQRVVVNHEGRTGTDLANAIGQDARDAAANVAGVDFNGSVPVAMLMPFADHLAEWLFMTVKGAEFRAKTGKNIFAELVYGTANDVNAGINFAGETNSGLVATFDADGYNGMLRGLYTTKMNGG